MRTTLCDVNVIVLHALSLPHGPKRAAYLDEACHLDFTSRRQVDAILELHTGANPRRPAAREPIEPRPAVISEVQSGLILVP